MQHQNSNFADLTVFGKPLPQAEQLEEAVLGALMLDKEACNAMFALGRLDVHSFHLERHKAIFCAIQELATLFMPVDLLTVAEMLKKQGNLERVGGAFYLVELTNRVASAANIEYHSLILAQKGVSRSLIELLFKCYNDAYDAQNDVFSIIDKLQKGVDEIANQRGGQDQKADTSTILDEIDNEVRGLVPAAPLVKLGIETFDELHYGLRQDDFVIVAGDSKSGKTALMCQMILATINSGKVALVYSYEMTAKQLTRRLIAQAAQISIFDLEQGGYNSLSESDKVLYLATWERFKASKHLLLICDKASRVEQLSLSVLSNKFILGDSLGGVFIDYFQIIPHDEKNSVEASVKKAQALRRVRLRVNVPFVVLSQYTKRNLQNRPFDTDLYEGKELLNACTRCLHIYRPSMFDVQDFASDNQPTIGKGEIYCDTSRIGTVGRIRLCYDSHTTTWRDDLDGSSWSAFQKEAQAQTDIISLRLENTPF
jgi:replicative DNA helicase